MNRLWPKKAALVASFILSLLAACLSPALPLATHTSVSSTSTENPPTETASAADYIKIQEQCIELKDEAPPRIQGVLGLYLPAQGNDVQSYLLNLDTGERIPLGDTFFEMVSPDQRRLVFWDYDLDKSVISDANGNRLEVISGLDSVLYDWLNDDYLLFSKEKNEGNEDNPSYLLVAMNINTNETIEFDHNNYPDIIDYLPQHSEFIYLSPNLKTLLYAEQSDWVLWDIQANMRLGDFFFFTSENPVWSPDGSQFLIYGRTSVVDSKGKTHKNIDDGLPNAGGWDLFLVSETGSVERLTYFSSFGAQQITFYDWTPDGTKAVVFLQDMDEMYKPYSGELALIDVETKVITKYCVEGWPIFSPDGRYAALRPLDKSEGFIVYIVDFQTMEGWLLSDDAGAWGWLVSQP